MEKKNVIFKLNIKDYNSQLEKILLKKTFSEDVKNLLLSMLYKIENAYEDYQKVRVNVKHKSELLEEILNTIEYRIETIEVIKPKMEEIIDRKKSIINKKQKKIITYPNEKAILNAILKMNLQEYIVQDKNKLISASLEKLLNEGNRIAINEIIRDFDRMVLEY